MPPHVSDSDHSNLAMMTQGQYDESSDCDIQNLLRRKNLIITDRPVPKLEFNEEGLEVLNTTMEPVTMIQGKILYISEFVL